MSETAATTKVYYDVITSFEQGVNSGITPILLPKNQLAFALNATVRGGNVAGRPPLQIQGFNFGGDTALETAVLHGFFQGAGVYRPDFGPTQIVAQISGRLFAFTPAADFWTVTDISVPGDLNDPNAPLVWMWQSEKWLIVQNGLVLPIFYDGVTSRRSYGPSVVLGTVSAISPGTPPALGETVLATIGAPYAGPYNIPVIFNGAFYQPVNDAGGLYRMNLQRISVLPGSNGSPPAAGVPVYAIPNRLGPVTRYDINPAWAAANGWSFTPFGFAHSTFSYGLPVSSGGRETIENFQVPLDIDLRLNVGDQVSFFGNTFTVLEVKNTVTVKLQRTLTPAEWLAGNPSLVARDYQAGTPAYVVGNNSPSVLIGTIQSVVSSSGEDFVVAIDREYTGGTNQAVYLGTVNPALYIANPPAAIPPAGNDVTLINLSDTSTDPYALPQDILSVPELPAGRMGAYGMGRNWMSLIDGISYIAGDIVGGAAGTVANDYRDSVLKTTENDYLSGGGSFRLPGSGNIITSMTFMATLDASQGQGALQIGTDSGFFSNHCPVDRDTWQNLTNPILTQSMIGTGPLAQNSTISVNSDILFRSIEGLASLVIARKNFNAVYSWGNSPISREMDPILRADNPDLLLFGSAVNFDNRMIITTAPTPNATGTYHRGAVVLNFDTINSLTAKSNPVYDGLWTGLNILQFLTGNFSGTGRSFAFSFNVDDGTLNLYELLTSLGGRHFDNGDTRILWLFETPVMFNRDVKPMSELVRLLDGELYVQDVDGVVNFKVEYRPDFYPCWELWKEGEICADRTITDGKPGYRTRVSLGDPPSDACEPSNENRLLRVGHFFQFRFTFTGYLKFMGFRAQVTTDPTVDFAPPSCAVTCPETIPMPQ